MTEIDNRLDGSREGRALWYVVQGHDHVGAFEPGRGLAPRPMRRFEIGRVNVIGYGHTLDQAHRNLRDGLDVAADLGLRRYPAPEQLWSDQ